MATLTPFHVAIQVRDLEEARAFYGDLLGFAEGRSDSHWIDYNFFGHQFVVHWNPNLGRDGTITSHYNGVDGHGVPVPHFGVVLDLQVGEQRTFFLLDPTGNALEFKAFADIDGQLFAK
jgi:extradiol dioxygenase family protein